MRRASVVAGVLAVAMAAIGSAQQSPTQIIPDTTRADSLAVDSAVADTGDSTPVPPPPPPPPTEEQQRYLQGLQRVGRGIAQLKTAIDRVSRSEASRDTVSQRRASRRLGGYCGSASSFMRGGRARMDHSAYADSTGMSADRLAKAVDELLEYTPTCELEAGTQTAEVSRELLTRLRAYDAALADFRAAIGLPTARTGGGGR